MAASEAINMFTFVDVAPSTTFPLRLRAARELYRQGVTAAHFYHLAAKFKAALFRHEIGSADIAEALIDYCC